MMNGTMMARAAGWVQEGRGWWVKDGVGGICRERDRRWYFYPSENGPYEPMSYSSLVRAIYAAVHSTKAAVIQPTTNGDSRG